jgi:hypothetical protein
MLLVSQYGVSKLVMRAAADNFILTIGAAAAHVSKQIL